MINFGLGVSLHTPENVEQYRAWRNDPFVWRWTRQNDLISKAQNEEYWDSLKHNKTIQMYEIKTHENWEVGVCGLTSINKDNSNAEFSLFISPEARAHGFSKPALLTLFHHGFTNMGLKSIWGETFENNPARQIFKKIGMKEDGIRRKFYWKDGRFWDAILVSFLDDEFFEKHGVRSCFGELP